MQLSKADLHACLSLCKGQVLSFSLPCFSSPAMEVDASHDCAGQRRQQWSRGASCRVTSQQWR